MILQVLFFVLAAVSARSTDASVVAPPGLVPHHVGVFGLGESFLDPNKTVYSFVCSGAIISPDTVLITASCVDPKYDFAYTKGYAVLAGFVNTSAEDVVYTGVQEVRRHFNYVEGDRNADIAVLKLGAGLTLNENVQSIAIRDLSAASVGADCIISGWRTDMLTVSAVLRTSNLTMLDKTKCEEAGDGEICAGGTPQEDGVGCQLGDEASPISCDGLLTGLLHYSYDTCGSEPQLVMGDVYYHQGWIQSQLATEPLESTSTSSSTTSESSTATLTSSVDLTSTQATITSTIAEVSSSTTAEVSSSTTAEVSSSTTAEVSSSTTGEVSSSTTAEVSSSTTAVDSYSTTAEVSSSTTAEVSSSTTSEVSSSTTAEVSSSTTGVDPTSTTDVDSSSTTGVDSSSTTAEVSSSTTAEVSSSTTDVDSSSTTDVDPSSTTGVDSSSTTGVDPTSTTGVDSSSTTGGQQTTPNDHPTGEICFGSGATLTSSLIAVLLLAAVIGVIQ